MRRKTHGRISNGQDLLPIATAAASLRGIVTSRTPSSPIKAALITARRRKGTSRRGYCRAQFESAWERYCAEGVTARARYPAPTVGLPPWYRFATNGLLLRYIAGGGERYTN